MLCADTLPVSPYIDTPASKVKEQVTNHILATSSRSTDWDHLVKDSYWY